MNREDKAGALIGSRSEGVFIELPAGNGSIPVLTVRAASLAETWELSLLALYGHGSEIRTDYDRKDESGTYIDPPSLDCTMRMVVSEPFAEPVIHRCFPGGLEDLEEYRQEVLDGIKDHWCRDPQDPDDNRWEYTYHQRVFNYTVPGQERGIDQVEKIVQGLCQSPYSRRQQAVVWKVWEDVGIEDPACMQSLWFRILPDENGRWRLNLNVRFRSRDAYDAAYMNCFALVHLMREVADRLEKKAGRSVLLGRYVDESDSYHIYGNKLDDFQNRFLKQVESRKLEDRTWTMEFARDAFREARPGIRSKIEQHDRRKKS
ncbi:MAG: thymidylate synthase [bacterium]